MVVKHKLIPPLFKLDRVGLNFYINILLIYMTNLTATSGLIKI